ncbi:MAG TPA: ASCH domain-containing protein [Dermatophilaceae bacterium]
MKALTIYQPWATLITLGVKRMETRSWDTKVRGPVAIHAGLAWPCRLGQRVEVGPYEVERDQSGLLLRGPFMAWPYRLPMGAVVAIGDLFQTRSTTNPEHCPDDWERSLGDHSPGRFAFSFASISRMVEPIPAVGRQRFWAWDMPAGLVLRAVARLAVPPSRPVVDVPVAGDHL